MNDAQMHTERIGLVGFLRVMRGFRRFAKLNRRPWIPADAARGRYEPLMESLAAERRKSSEWSSVARAVHYDGTDGFSRPHGGLLTDL